MASSIRRSMPKMDNVIGVSDHGGWAVLVAADRHGTLAARRRIELVDDLPGLPHHHEGQMLLVAAAVELVERVRASAEKHATAGLEAIATAVPAIGGIALRACPVLPPTIAERIKDYRARNLADWVMYRRALASAAQARGWPVHWYDAKTVVASAGDVLQTDFSEHFRSMRKSVGPPWNRDHELAMAAAIVAAANSTKRARARPIR